jgi:hypothetical protein
VSRATEEGLPGRTPADRSLSDTVEALRDEITGLRAAARTRAVIEQAKGVLVERHQIGLAEAFDRLRAMSQEHNVRLVEVAATVVGVAVPDAELLSPELPDEVVRARLPASPAASRSWIALQAQPEVRAGVLTALVDSVAGSASHGDEAAQLLAALLAPQGVTAVALYRSSADESLRLVGSTGVPGDLISSWRSIPPSREIPYVVSVQDGVCHFWGDREARARDFPGVSTTRSQYQATATVPIDDAGRTIGVAGLMWATTEEFDPDRVALITSTVQRVAPLLLRNAAAADPDLEWLNTVLRLHLDPWLLLETIANSKGVVSDFVVLDASPGLADATGWVGRRLLELWPGLADDGVGPALAGLARSGGAWTMTVAALSPAPWGLPGSRVRAVRLGSRIAMVWRPGRESDRRS